MHFNIKNKMLEVCFKNTHPNIYYRASFFVNVKEYSELELFIILSVKNKGSRGFFPER